MKRILIATLLGCCVFGTAAWAEEPTATVEKPYLYASQSAQITAVVEAIDHETREVTLRGPQGNVVTLIASEEARNLGQVSVGDLVTTEYTQSLEIQVLPGDGSDPGAGAVSIAGRAEEGAMPGAAVVDAQVVTATVEEIDIDANTFKLRFPDDSVQQFVARDPENLKRSSVGDLVVITTTESLAIAVEKVEQE